MRARVSLILIMLGLLLSLSASPVAAAGLTVNTLADTAPADDGSCTLREAITAANTDTASGATPGECAAGSGTDVISFSVSGTITLSSALPSITTNLSVLGAGAITVSGANIVRVFNVASGTVTLSGLTITNGRASGGVPGATGGGILNSGALTVTNSTITNNATEFGPGVGIGGGIHNSGALTLTNSTISLNNSGYRGGGVFNQGTATVTASTIDGNGSVNFGGGIENWGTLTVASSTISGNGVAQGDGAGIGNFGVLTVTGSTISDNTANHAGGGIFNQDGDVTVRDSTISGNSADVVGGGIFSDLGTLTVTGSTISGNTAVDSGGLYNGGVATLTNATISGNTAENSGGAIINDLDGTLTITNGTLSGNAANQGFGGGIYGLGTETLVNAIVAGNTNTFGDIGDNIETVTTSIIGVPAGKTLADILVPAGLANNGGPTQTIALAQVAGNPAIDTGTSAVCAAAPVNGVDQRGLPRPAACDIGAYEVQPTVPLPDAAMAQPGATSPWIALGFGMLLIGSLGVLAVANLGVVRRR